MSYKTKMASISLSAHTTQSIAEAAQRTLNGTLNPATKLRTMNTTEALTKLTPESMNKMAEDVYCRKLVDMQAGLLSYMRVASWKRAVDEFQTYMRMRLMTNWERLMSHPADAVAVAMMPFAVMCPHPSKAQADAWQKRWDDDGDLYRYVSSKCPNALVFPTILYEGTNDKSPVQFCVLIIRPPL